MGHEEVREKWVGKSQFFKVTVHRESLAIYQRGIAIKAYGPAIVIFFENGQNTEPLSITRFQEGVHWIHGWHRNGSKAIQSLMAARMLFDEKPAEW